MVNLLAMKNIRSLFKINIATYFLIVSFLVTGLIKNIIFIYLIVVVHELGHIIMLKYFKKKIIRVDIYPMGGVTTVDKRVNTPIKEEVIVAISGVVFQLILGLIFIIIFKLGFISRSSITLFANYNKTIMMFNLLPIVPLDGYIIMRNVIEKFCPFKKSFFLSFFISGVFMILFGTFRDFFSLNNYLVISFLIYKMVVVLKDFKLELWKFQLERYLFDIKYKKIKNEKEVNLNLLKKDTYHFFKNKDTYVGERKILEQKFHQNRY